MVFEWDQDKNESNRKKHGIDFETARNIWLDDNRVEIEAPYPIESRWIVIGDVAGKIWVAVYTIRNGTIRIISVRRARAKGIKLYGKKTTG